MARPSRGGVAQRQATRSARSSRPTRSAQAPAPRGGRRTRPAAQPRRRASTGSAPPLLTGDQRRELVGLLTVAAGVGLAGVLAVPDGGSIAGPLHDRALDTLGAAAWLLAAGLAIVGVRCLGRWGWGVSLLATVGGGMSIAAAMALLGIVDGADAGRVGRALGNAGADRLGAATSVLTLAVIGLMGLVLAADIHPGRLIQLAGEQWHAQRELAAADRAATSAMEAARVAERSHPTPEDHDHPLLTVMGRATPTVAEAPDKPSRRRQRFDLEAPPAVSVDTDTLVPLLGLGLGGPAPGEATTDDPAAGVGNPPLPGPVLPFTRAFEGLDDGGEGPALPAIAGDGDPDRSTGADVTVAEAGRGSGEGIDSGEADPIDADPPPPSWVLPSLDLLEVVVSKRERLEQEIRGTIVAIETTLASFGVDCRVRGVNSGPTVTQYELQPGTGVPVRRIVSFQTDLSLALAAPIRIQAPIPGKAAIGLEVPNKAAQLVTLKDIVAAQAFADTPSRLAVALGADVSGVPVIGDLARMPHLLIAGATGSGKSVCINAVLAGFLLQASPANLKMILVDPKRVELSGFADIPHLLVPVVVEPEAAVAALRWAVREMEERYKLFAGHGARNIAAFNERAPELGLEALPNIVIVIDELADLMMVAAGEIEDLICRIAQLARAVGIHLIVATQRPSADIITGLIKANIPSRIAFAVSSGVDSRVILDEMGAEKLLGRGDMLYLPIDEGKSRRLQGAYVSDRELDRLIGHWKAQGMPTYQEEIFQVEATASWTKDAGKRDPLFAKAAHTVAAEGRAAASLLQRKLSIGYTRAARLVDQLGEHGIIGPYEGSKSRDVLMDPYAVDRLLADLGEE